MTPPWLQAAFWGGVSGSALIVGAAAGYWINVPKRLVAGIMAFGSGVLLSALAFELMDEAFRLGGLSSTGAGFLTGAVIYSAANWSLARRGAKHRKRSGRQQPSESEQSGSGIAIAVGALLDGVPESMAIGLSLLGGGVVSLPTVAAIFLSNLPEALSSSAGMKGAGRPRAYIFGVWSAIALSASAASVLGYTLSAGFPPWVLAATTAVAGGAILTMIVDTMIPEAFAETHDFAGLIAVVGFLSSFALSKAVGCG